MKQLIRVLLFIFFTTLVSRVQAQSLEDILEKHFKAVGQEKLVSAQTYLMKAKIVQMGMELPMVMKIKNPNKFRVEMEMQGQKMIQAYDGEKGWMIVPWLSPDPQEMAGDQLKQAMEQADIKGELYNYSEKGHSVDFTGKVNLDGKEAYRLKLTAKDGTVKNYFIDTETYLITKVKAKVNTMGQEVDVDMKMSGYKDFDGVKMAMKMESHTPMETMSVIIEDVQFDPIFDDAIFNLPVK